ncbi:MAG: hypothetical protein IPH53_13690 [Flavobacteriales bacterium]|nr:hypothetical protein [Flavobacteriales bacterium]
MRSALILAMAAAFLSCKKESVMPTTPEIEIVSASPTQVDEFAEGVVLRFSYKDGDGDLGEADPDAYTFWVKDSRLNAADGYHIPPLAPPDTEVPIQGELEVTLTPLFLLGSSGQEVMTYTFYITDRAGNKSNELVTSSITVVADTTITP